MSDTPEQEPVIRPFADFFAELRKGAVADEASRALHDLTAAVQETRKPGRITITVELGIHKDTDMLVIKDGVASKLPRLPRPASMWYVDDAGNPTRRDPTQLEFEGIRAVPTNQNRKNA